MDKRTNKDRVASQSIVNNFHSYRNGGANAERAKYYLRRLRQLTGLSEQFLITDLLLTGFSESSKYRTEREQIRQEADKLFTEETEMI